MCIRDRALTAVDRPYKKGKTLSEAIKIMSFMKKDQHIDPDLFDLFPVPYTHLDVYKRQVKCLGETLCSLCLGGSLLQSTKAVSYTHLDVYKRQLKLLRARIFKGTVVATVASEFSVLDMQRHRGDGIKKFAVVADDDHGCLLYTSRCV